MKLPRGDRDEWRKFSWEGLLGLELPRDRDRELLSPPGFQEVGRSGWIDDAEARDDPVDFRSTVDRFAVIRNAEVDDQGGGREHGVDVA